MKIYDIIREDEQQLDEFGGLLRAAGAVLKPVASAIGKFGGTASNAATVGQAAGKVAKAAKGAKAVKAPGPNTPTSLGTKIHNARAGASIGYGNAMNLSDEAIKWYTRYKGIWEPISEYNDNMAVWDKKLKAGEITEKEYEYAREKYLSYLIGRIGTYVTVSGMIRTTALPMVAGLRLFKGTRNAGTTLSVLARGANLYIVTEYLNSPEGKDLVAKAFAEGPLGDAVAPIIGGSAAKLIDKLKGKVREKDPEDDAEAEKDAAPVNTLAGPAVGYNPEAPKDQPDTPSNLVRDPKTGKLTIKTDY